MLPPSLPSDPDECRLIVLAGQPTRGDYWPHEGLVFLEDTSSDHLYLHSYWPENPPSTQAVGRHHTLDSAIAEQYPAYRAEPAVHLPGQYHPRIWRLNWPPDVRSLAYRESWRNTGVSFALISDMLQHLVRVVEPAPANRLAYGHEIAQLLIRACEETEVAWRGVLAANGRRIERPITRDFLHLKRPMRLDEWSVRLTMHGEWSFQPFQGWSAEAATQSLPWYDAYNAVKHDRESNLPRASLDNALNAVAAAFIMMTAQFGEGTLADFGVSPMASFEIVSRPAWSPQELYFGAGGLAPTSVPLWR